MPPEDAINALVTRYAEIVDARTFGDLEEVFTTDAVLDTGRGRREGVDEIRTAMVGLHRYDETRHVVGVVRLDDVAGEQARGTVECIAHHWFTAHGRRLDRQMTITYHDRYITTDAGWRIDARRLEIHATVEMSAD
ncbi:MAG: nuclear transport factor 2 family protein [Actinomycetota bacterium]